MRRVRVTIERLYYKDRKSIRNSVKTSEKHRETERQHKEKRDTVWELRFSVCVGMPGKHDDNRLADFATG
jgi:hypothetical protein